MKLKSEDFLKGYFLVFERPFLVQYTRTPMLFNVVYNQIKLLC